MYVSGDLFQSPAKVLVNTVNTVGVMGKGVARDFKRLFPEMFEQYRQICDNNQLQIGTLWLYKSPNKWVLNLPTKTHWRRSSKVEYIEAGLRKFAQAYSEMGVHSVAFPPLGCGNGQLDFSSQVQPLMEMYLRNLPIEVFIYSDQNDPFFVAEHENPREFSQWLRSEPRSLPFAEVWDDLERVLHEHEPFHTISNTNSFQAHINQAERTIDIEAANQRYRVPYDTLLAFWQQLRTHGFSMRHIAPGVDRQLSYLVPIFAELPYVKPVKVADSFKGLSGSPITGLQILPTAFRPQPSTMQLPLFELA